MGSDGRHLNVSLTVRGNLKSHKTVSVIIVFCLFVVLAERQRQRDIHKETDRETDRAGAVFGA